MPHSKAIQELLSVFAKAQAEEKERDVFVLACQPAAYRLAAYAWRERHESDQAAIILGALASIYNGSTAPTIRLDELRWLAWPHQKDLIAVIFGIGSVDTPDTLIREAFNSAGGSAAVSFLHLHVSGLGEESSE